MDKLTIHKRYLCPVLLLMAALAGCATVPVTGRRQAAFVSQSAMVSQSADIYDAVLKEIKLSDDAEKKRMLSEVGSKIALAAERFMEGHGLAEEKELYDWKFFLIEDDQNVNAFVLPGGKAGVYTGIFKVVPDEASLAVVLGHEVAHVIARHGSERMSHQILVALGRATLAAALEQRAEEQKQLWSRVYGIGSQVGVMLPYSRKQEEEADRIGLIITAMAGYDPSEALNLWRNMASEQKRRPITLLSTHPVPERRIENIKDYLPEALRYYEPGEGS